MKIISELSFFPPIQFYQNCVGKEEIILEKWENYQKNGFRNRFVIATANGTQLITIPLQGGKNEQKPITEVEISYETNWQRHAWQSILSAYGRAPYFEHYESHLKIFFEKEYHNLWDLNLDVFNKINKLLKIELNCSFSDDYIKKYDENDVFDFRSQIRPNADIDTLEFKKYNQLFEERHGFIKNLSILDLLFCTGPQAKNFI